MEHLQLDGYALPRRGLARNPARQGTPEIFNTAQGSRFTSGACTGVLPEHGVQINMDGNGRVTDNAIIERLWRSVKYKNVDL